MNLENYLLTVLAKFRVGVSDIVFIIFDISLFYVFKFIKATVHDKSKQLFCRHCFYTYTVQNAAKHSIKTASVHHFSVLFV